MSPYTVFSHLIIPLKGTRGYDKKQLGLCCAIKTRGVNDTADLDSAVSMTPLSLILQCQWHRWAWLCCVIDTAELDSAVSLTPRNQHVFFSKYKNRPEICSKPWTPSEKLCRKWIMSPNQLFNHKKQCQKFQETASLMQRKNCWQIVYKIFDSTVSLTLWSQWHRGAWLCSINDTAELDSAVSMTPRSFLCVSEHLPKIEAIY